MEGECVCVRGCVCRGAMCVCVVCGDEGRRIPLRKLFME